MNFSSYITTSADIRECASAGIGEVLIEARAFSRIGRLENHTVTELAKEAKGQGLCPVLVWDLLLSESELTEQAAALQAMDLSSLDAVRVQDLGAAKAVVEILHLPLHLCVEGASHNLDALRMWQAYFAPGLRRLVLSIQLDEDALLGIIPNLEVPCEILGAGPVQMFYSKRRLLMGEGAQPGCAEIFSEDSDERPFNVIETEHGTFIYLDRDFFILDRFWKLAEAGLHTLRLDLRPLAESGDACAGAGRIVRDLRDGKRVDRSYWRNGRSSPLLFSGNNTSKIFGALKRHRYAG